MDVKSSASFLLNGTTPVGQALSDAFHFEIPCWTSTTREEDDGRSIEIATCLPSSIRVLCNSTSVTTRPCCIGECTVAYKITATATARGAIIAETTHRIDILPTLDPGPPVWIEDFLGEYVNYHMVNLRSSVLQRPLGILSLRATEPSPLIFSQEQRFASSNMTLNLYFQQSLSRVGCDPPPTAQLQVRIRLKVVTIVSVVAQKKQPTEHEANASPFSKRKEEECGREAIWTLLFSPWRARRRLLFKSGNILRHLEEEKFVDKWY